MGIGKHMAGMGGEEPPANFVVAWNVIEGQSEGISQMARKSSGQNRRVVWNFPLDIAFKSTNAFGWPQLVISVYGMDFWTRDVIRGYGRVHLPISPGRYTKYIRLFAPAPSSYMQGLMSAIQGNPPEFVSSSFIAEGEGREAVRVNSEGLVKVQFNVVTKDMSSFGYSDGL